MPLTRIFHLSDLHIRNGDNIYSRYEEYRSVFMETITSIKLRITDLELSFEDFVIVITGDIFHNKNVIGNYGLFVYREFIQALSNIGRLYIISGNHDYDQSDIDKPSLVYSSTFDIPNVIVLNTSTSFIIDNVGFSFVSIDKTLDIYRNSGRIQDLPTFPCICSSCDSDVKYKVALFHGSFASAKLYNGKAIEETFNPYPLEWVQDFDYVLLGDIHRRQVFTYKKKTMCGYSGSLIQQNFGEDIIDHGFLLWNLETKNVEEINVYNNIGYINIIEDISQEIYIRTNGKYTVPLRSYLEMNAKSFPKIVEIKSYSNINYQTLSALFNAYGISFQIVSKLNTVMNMNVPSRCDACDRECLLDTNYLLVYFKKILSDDKYQVLLNIMKDKEYLLFDTLAYPEDLHTECIKRNKDLEPIIRLCNDADDRQSLKKSFVIQYLEWDGLLCYENKCMINFKDLDAKTFMIKGANGTGKSAIYDILQLALWATNNKFDTYSAGFINHNKEKGYTIIEVAIDNITYRIKREFCKKKDTFKITNKTSVLSKYNEAGDLVILKKDSACNTEVKALFGDINTFLSTSMITQNVDNDILALNYKDTLETIDKSHNIQFIYHLYNLFKTAINKYRDFRKVVLSKKEVYEKLLFNGTNSEVNDNVILQLTDELSTLHAEETTLRQAFNSIPIDMNDPSHASIIATDYTSSMEEIKAKYTIVSTEVLEEYREKLHHYKYLHTIRFGSRYRNGDGDDCDTLYSQQLEDDFNKLPCVNKPCDISYLANEKRDLEEYIDIDIDVHTEDLVVSREALVVAKNLLGELISNKPNKVSGMATGRDIDKIIRNIVKVYGSIDVFNDFISSHTKPRRNEKRERNGIDIPRIARYTNALQQKDIIIGEISHIHNQLATYESDFNTLFSKQQNIKIVNIPRESCGIVKSAKSVAKELKHYNIDTIELQIAEDDKIINEYLLENDELQKLATEIENSTKELQHFSRSEEYRYNPECSVCCNRPWVSRIKDIQITLHTLDTNMTTKRQRMKYSESDFAMVQKRFEEHNKKKMDFHLLNEWYHYYKFKEANMKITNDMNSIIEAKATLHKELTHKDAELNTFTTYIEYFVAYSFMLYEEYLCDIYKEWEMKYNETKHHIEELEKTIHYHEIIRPRIAKYRELQKTYDEWVTYDNTKRIIDTHHYYTLKAIIDANNEYREYESNERMKPLILRKLELNETLKEKEGVRKMLNDKVVKYTTINTYNNENKRNYNSLVVIESELDTIIDVIDTILINFQSFRKELYDTIILTRLVEKTNAIIKTLCHQNTKPFKLNYNVDITNDTVHINWLIHNDNVSCDDTKQYISVSQASGFQRFAISLALRMSLYFNNYDVLCKQLFIDEGFINFDKNNLSVVPVFLKSLLHYFNTIVILSHIDIIQDSVDETAEIRFNKTDGVSSLVYR